MHWAIWAIGAPERGGLSRQAPVSYLVSKMEKADLEDLVDALGVSLALAQSQLQDRQAAGKDEP